MRIGITGLTAWHSIGGGSVYLSQLTEALARYDAQNTYVLFLNKREAHRYAIRDSERFASVIIDIPSRLSVLTEQVVLPILLHRYPVDILHTPVSAVPVFSSARSVMTLYDATVFKYPETTRRSIMFYWKTFRLLGAKKAHYIITISESARRDLIDEMHIPNSKIKVCHLAIDTQKFHPVDSAGKSRIIQKYKLITPFLLCVGKLQPRKNIVRLVRAFAELRREYNLEHQLVLAGPKGWSYEEIFQTVQSLGLGEHVRFTGYVDDEDLAALYSMADVSVYPSLYEGFGLPVLEAMACGTPVITSNLSSLPEVAGDAAVLCDPFDVHAIAKAIWQVVTDSELSSLLIRKGFNRVNKFSLESLAHCHLSVYEKCLG